MEEVTASNDRHAPGLWKSLASWFDNTAVVAGASGDQPRRIDWTRQLPFIGLHLGCLAVFWVGTSATALLVAAGLYMLRMFAITGFYHRYFSHNAFRTSRAAQFAFALLGASGVQRGPLWWASQHRHHHAHADLPQDSHSSLQHGFLWSHMGWFMARENFATRTRAGRPPARYPELRFLDRYDALVPALLCVALYAIGALLEHFAPGLGTNGAQLVVWGFCISTVALYHATFTINSLAHSLRPPALRHPRRFAQQPLARAADVRRRLAQQPPPFPGRGTPGFYWWEIDLTYYGLRLLAALGIIWDLKEVPIPVREARRVAGRRT